MTNADDPPRKIPFFLKTKRNASRLVFTYLDDYGKRIQSVEGMRFFMTGSMERSAVVFLGGCDSTPYYMLTYLMIFNVWLS